MATRLFIRRHMPGEEKWLREAQPVPGLQQGAWREARRVFLPQSLVRMFNVQGSRCIPGLWRCRGRTDHCKSAGDDFTPRLSRWPHACSSDLPPCVSCPSSLYVNERPQGAVRSDRQDIIGIATTGSGKTVAFLFPAFKCLGIGLGFRGLGFRI